MEKLKEKIYYLKSKTSPVLFYGKNEENISLIEKSINARLIPRGNEIKIIGTEYDVQNALDILSDIETVIIKNNGVTTQDILTTVNVHRSQSSLNSDVYSPAQEIDADFTIQTFSKIIKPKSQQQEQLVKAIAMNDLVFAIGPAGTGKTYLAVAQAVQYLKQGLVKRIVLSRPAVEAGESLGFLPGDFKEKIDPYLKPLFDALTEMVPKDMLKKYFDYETIEIIPLAYMRGRTLNNAFVILDEAQNSTFIQMKMFLTRLGQNSKAVVTGDITQVDLDSSKKSGLISSIHVLKDVNMIEFVELSEKDVIRHPLVKEIINAYERFSNNEMNFENPEKS